MRGSDHVLPFGCPNIWNGRVLGIKVLAHCLTRVSSTMCVLLVVSVIDIERIAGDWPALKYSQITVAGHGPLYASIGGSLYMCHDDGYDIYTDD